MLRFGLNLVISVAVILGATWLSKRQPGLAGFVTALPITSMLVLVLSHLDETSMTDQARFARSLLLGIPLSCAFLLPFAAAPRLNLGFWPSFAAGLALLACGYAIHRAVIGHS
jgi:hypothetical protein